MAANKLLAFHATLVERETLAAPPLRPPLDRHWAGRAHAAPLRLEIFAVAAR